MKTNTQATYACLSALLFLGTALLRASLAEANGSGDVTNLKIENCSMSPFHLRALGGEDPGVTLYFHCGASVEVNLVTGQRTRVVVTYAGSLATKNDDLVCASFETGYDREVSYDDTINLSASDTTALMALEIGEWPAGGTFLWRDFTTYLEAEGVEQRGWGWTYHVATKVAQLR